MESRLQTHYESVKAKSPEIRKNLEMVNTLIAKRVNTKTMLFFFFATHFIEKLFRS